MEKLKAFFNHPIMVASGEVVLSDGKYQLYPMW
jgi:hypothetical protein